MNKQLLKQYKFAHEQLKQSIPAIYASLIIALYESCNVSVEDIEYIIAESQRIWTEHAGNGSLSDMLAKCEEITGIEVRSL